MPQGLGGRTKTHTMSMKMSGWQSRAQPSNSPAKSRMRQDSKAAEETRCEKKFFRAGTRAPPEIVRQLATDDDALAAGGALTVNLVVLGRALRRVVRVAAAAAAAVELDALASAGDAVALTGAARAGAADT